MKNTFKNNLNENHGITLLKFSYNGIEFQIRATEHSLERFKENNIDVNIACGDIISLGKERLYQYSERGDDVAIIDKDNNFVIVITFEGYQVRLKTLIPRANAFIKEGTKIFVLNDYKGGF